MARIKWKNPNDQLSGTFCGLVYKMRYGKQFVYSQPEPKLPKNATRAQKAKYDRERIVQECVSRIQDYEFSQGKQSVQRMQQIAGKYHAIKIAVERMYNDFLPKLRHRETAMKGAIIYWYKFKRLAPELELFKDDLPAEYRECIGNGSRMDRE